MRLVHQEETSYVHAGQLSAMEKPQEDDLSVEGLLVWSALGAFLSLGMYALGHQGKRRPDAALAHAGCGAFLGMLIYGMRETNPEVHKQQQESLQPYFFLLQVL